MKKHKSITVSYDMISNLGACTRQKAMLSPLLPAKLHTQPLKNMKLALTLAETTDWAGDTADLYWFCNATGITLDVEDSDNWRSRYDSAESRYIPDAYVIAQQLAFIADALLTKQGR